MKSLVVASALVVVLSMFCVAGCKVEGISVYDTQKFGDGAINGGLGADGLDYSYAWSDPSLAPTVGSLMVFLYHDATGKLALGYGFVAQHPTDLYYFVEVDFTTPLPYPGAYSLGNYLVVAFDSPYAPPVPQVTYLDPFEIEQISYLPDRENMVQFVWPDGSSDMLPWGSALEVDYDDGNGLYFTNVCNISPIFERVMCRMYGIGIGSADVQNRSNWTIKVVDETPYPYL